MNIEAVARDVLAWVQFNWPKVHDMTPEDFTAILRRHSNPALFAERERLKEAIMSIPCRDESVIYADGHSDARHAAAELVLAAEPSVPAPPPGSELERLRERLAEAEKSRDSWRRMFHSTTRDMMSRGLACLAGAVTTPEAGYMEDGGLNRMWADLETLRSQYDNLKSRAALEGREVSQ